MIIGITGTFAAGKGTIVKFLQKHGYKHYSARKFITKEIIKRNLEVNRDTMIMVANDLRENFGPAYIAEELYKEAKENGGDAVIESLRCVGEIEHLRKFKDFILLAVDADQKIRYDRAVNRNSETDMISFEKFQFQEKMEMNTDDDFKQNLSACIKLADIKIDNNDTKEHLKQKLLEELENAK